MGVPRTQKIADDLGSVGFEPSIVSCADVLVNFECNTDGPSDQLDIVAGSRNMNSCFFLIMEKTFLVKNQHKIGWLGG
jgi:hypothetical protein